MLTIDIQLNGRRIAGAKVRNVSDLAALSDYEVLSVEHAFEEAGLPAGRADFKMHDRPRLRSVWHLVGDLARRAAAIRDKDGPDAA